MAIPPKHQTLAVEFNATTLLEPRKRQWQSCEPSVRVRPHNQLRYAYPILKQGEYTVEQEAQECDLPVSDQGPAAGDLHNDTANQGPKCEKV